MGGSWGTAHEVLHTGRSIGLDLGCGAADPKGQQQTRPADADDAALNGDRKWMAGSVGRRGKGGPQPDVFAEPGMFALDRTWAAHQEGPACLDAVRRPTARGGRALLVEVPRRHRGRPGGPL